VTSLGEIIEETARFSIRGSNVSAKFEISPDLWAANVDPNQISQVIQNLVINADQAMPDGGMITIKAENVMVKRPGPLGLKPGPYVAISVIDQGHGIEKDILPKIFDPYFSTKEGGSGLGLATTHSIVKRHDGAIEIESTPGHGSRFTVYLPAVPGAPTTRSERVELSAEKKEVKGGRILVMDDEEAIRSLTIDVLKMLGYEAVSVSNGEEAIRLYKRAMEEGRPFDAVIMDLTIAGGMGGEEAAKKIREIDPETKIIVSSGYSSSAVMSQYRLHGFDAALPKPYNINQLREVLLEVLEEGDRSGKSAKTV
ncbi:MAG TPA: response regulator, partial [Dissulfuribacter thermophilus]|nr:response regulator [Dissulfuribacter thermophilus]